MGVGSKQCHTGFQSGWRRLGRWRISVGPPSAPGGKASSTADKGTRPSWREGSYATSHLTKLCCSRKRWIISMRRRWKNSVERLRDVHLYRYGSARGLSLVEAKDHHSNNWEQGRGGGVPRFEAVLGGACSQRLHDGREEESLEYLQCQAEHWDGAVGATQVSRVPYFSESRFWRSSSKLPGYQLRQLRGWRALSRRPGSANLDSGGGARWSYQAPRWWKSPPS